MTVANDICTAYEYFSFSVSRYGATFFIFVMLDAAALKLAIGTCCLNCFLHQLRKYASYDESLILLLMVMLMLLIIVMVMVLVIKKIIIVIIMMMRY